MNVLLRLTIFVCAALSLRGDDHVSGTMRFSPGGERSMETSGRATHQALSDFNLFRHDQSEKEPDEHIVRMGKYSSVHPSNEVMETETSKGKGKGKGKSRTSKKTGKGKGKRSSFKSMKSTKKENLYPKKSSKSHHSMKKKKQGKEQMNHVSEKGKGNASGPSASHPGKGKGKGKGHESGSSDSHHSSKNNVTGKGKGKGKGSYPSPSPVHHPTSSSPSVSPPHVMPRPPVASGPTSSPSGKSIAHRLCVYC